MSRPDYQRPEPALYAQIMEELPEISEIGDEDLRERVIAAWAKALNESSYTSIRQIPPAGNPGVMVLKRGNQTDHIRGVTRLAIKTAADFLENFPDLAIDRDILIAGCLCHDIGKTFEFDPVRRERWKANPAKSGLPALRHTAYGAYICLSVGLPDEVAHMAAAHSAEGELLTRSLENTILHHVDHTYWYVLLAGGLIEPDSVPAPKRN